MIVDFDENALREFSPTGRVNMIRFNGCIIAIHQWTEQVGTSRCNVCKINGDGTEKYFESFNLNDRNWRYKALITALQDDPLEQENLAKLVAMRMQNAN